MVPMLDDFLIVVPRKKGDTGEAAIAAESKKGRNLIPYLTA